MKKETYYNLGKFIHVYNDIERYINYIITHHIKPENIIFFLDYILNTTVINFGAKLKILINLDIFENNEVEKIRKYNSNRNVIVHNNKNDSFSMFEEIDKGVINVTVNDIILITNSKGKLINMNYNDFIKEHRKLQNEIIEIIVKYIIDNKINTEHNHVKNLLLYKKE